MIEERKDKRPIDRIRESAMSMSVGTPDDQTPITEMIGLGGILYIIKEGGVYATQLADKIDPQRTNASVPNVQQRILSIGSSSELVGKTLLTARELLNPTFLPAGFDKEAGLTLALSALKDLAAMQDMAVNIEEAQKKAEVQDYRQRDRSVLLPSVGDITAQTKAFAQKADHVLQSLLGIAKLLYGEKAGKRGFRSLAELVAQQYGVDDDFSKFMQQALPVLQFVRNVRNCVEHPKPDQYVVASDFTLSPALELVPPTIEVVHPKTLQPRIQASVFMRDVTAQLAGIFEVMLAFLSGKNAQPFAGFPIGIIVLLPEQRRSPHVRYSYGTIMGDQISPIG
ncbi:MAG: hypothetical protein NVV83_00135 [Afipia sp.]|nr:hypothetical protein [Afipia sp.]